jgi:ribonuclease III
VRKETCAEVARDLGLGAVLRIGRSEMMSGGRRKGRFWATRWRR